MQTLLLQDQDIDPNNLNNIGASFYFYVETLATDLDIKTDGTDKFKGAILIGVDDGAKKAFVPAATNDVITKLMVLQKVVSLVHNWQITAIDTAAYLFTLLY